MLRLASRFSTGEVKPNRVVLRPRNHGHGNLACAR
jgi:hypothetical protein